MQTLISAVTGNELFSATNGGDAQVSERGSLGEPPRSPLVGSRLAGPVVGIVRDSTLSTSDDPVGRVLLPEFDQRTRVEEQENPLLADYVLRVLFSTARAQGDGRASFETAPVALSAPSLEEQTPVELTLEAARIAGVALTIGAVWWALRAGGLLASLAASAPLWRNFDPLPILVDEDEEDDRDWGDLPDQLTAREEGAAARVFGVRDRQETDL